MKKRSILVQFLRHSGFWLTTSDDVNVVIDPVLSSRYRNEELVHPPFEPTAIEKADAVLITHLHPDHFDRETVNAIIRKTGATVIAPSDTINVLDLPDTGIRAVKKGQDLSIKSVKIRAIDVGTYGWYEEQKDNIGYRLLTGDGIEILHPSDSLPAPEDAMGLHILFLRIAWEPRMRARMVEFVKRTQPAYVMPMHYGTYTSIRMDPEEIRSELETERTKMLAFYPGQTKRIQFGSS